MKTRTHAPVLAIAFALATLTCWAQDVAAVSSPDQAAQTLSRAVELMNSQWDRKGARKDNVDMAVMAEAEAFLLAVAEYDPHFRVLTSTGLVEKRTYYVTPCVMLAWTRVIAGDREGMQRWAKLGEEDFRQAAQTVAVGPRIEPVVEERLASDDRDLPPLVTVNGSEAYERPAVDVNTGCSFVLLDEFAPKLGAELSWDGLTQSAMARLGQKAVVFTLGSPTALVKGWKDMDDGSSHLWCWNVDLRVAPYLENGRLMVPLKALVEALGGLVGWAPEPQIVYVTFPAPIATEPQMPAM